MDKSYGITRVIDPGGTLNREECTVVLIFWDLDHSLLFIPPVFSISSNQLSRSLVIPLVS